jgi:enamine deaminase RidA (YjgF/YER057c/UK114 family)
MSLQHINPPTLATSPGGHAQVIVATGSRLVVINGQVARDKDGNLVGGSDHVAQARQAFTNLRHALEAAGATGSDVVQYRLIIVNYSQDFIRAILDTAKEVFGDHPLVAPSVMVGATALGRPDLLVEVEAMAILD